MQRNLKPQFQNFSEQAFHVGIGVFLAAGLAIVLGVFIYTAHMKNRFLRGVAIGGIDIGGETMWQARDLLERQVQLLSSRIELVPHIPVPGQDQGAEKPVPAPLGALGVSVLLDDALHDAFAIGHKKLFWENVQEASAISKNPVAIPLRIEFNDDALDTYLLRTFSGTLEIPAMNAAVFLKDGRVAITPARSGRIIDRASLKKELALRVSSFDSSPIVLQAVPASPRISTKEGEAAKKRIEGVFQAAPYFLFGNGKRFTISETQVREWLEILQRPENIEIAFSQEAVEAYLLGIAPSMARETRDARLEADSDGKAFIAVPSQDALRLNIRKTAIELISRLREAHRSITAVMDETPARINERLLQERGITRLVGRGESSFTGSPRNRIQNIRVASEKYRGIFINPEEEFSFNAHLGTIDASSGYVPELVIKDKKLIPEYGGGICQVSTTLFRAAVFAGLKIAQRSNHSIPVRYYGTPGFDATVYPPSPDLKFVNTTTGTLFIQPHIEGAGLVFELYGNGDGRTVKIEGPRIVKTKPDGSMKTLLTQKVFEHGELVQQKMFWSLYKSPALYKIERNPLE